MKGYVKPLPIRGGTLRQNKRLRKTVANLYKAVDKGTRYGIPVMGVTAVGKDMARDAR